MTRTPRILSPRQQEKLRALPFMAQGPSCRVGRALGREDQHPLSVQAPHAEGDPVKRIRVCTTISPSAAVQIRRMLASGLWGTSVAQVVREVLYAGLRAEAVRTGKVPR